MDKDLKSIAEARELLILSEKAAEELSHKNQTEIDGYVRAVAEAGEHHAEALARLARDETGFGKWEDKKIKNIFASKVLEEAVRDIKTIGILREDTENKIIDVAAPVGVICGIVPSTNPTSTVLFKSIIAVKGGNSIVFSPHPKAAKATLEAVRIVKEALKKAGAPDNTVGCLTLPTMEATRELMTHPITKLILATGGPAMVRAAYSSGKPAIGVGAGNGPAFIDKSADVSAAVGNIIKSKTFDNGTICASEQSIIIEKSMETAVVKALKEQKAYILCEEESEKLKKLILRANGTMNPAIVGKSAGEVARFAGLINVPEDTSVLVAREYGVGDKYIYSHEKLAPILGFFIEENVESVLSKSIELLKFEGAGHTMAIHSENKELIKKFALKIPVSRILINTPASLGGVGVTTNLFPSLTLGCGAVGGSSSSNNIGPLDVINIKRVAWGVKSKVEENSVTADSIEIIVQNILKKLI